MGSDTGEARGTAVWSHALSLCPCLSSWSEHHCLCVMLRYKVLVCWAAEPLCFRPLLIRKVGVLFLYSPYPHLIVLTKRKKCVGGLDPFHYRYYFFMLCFRFFP